MAQTGELSERKATVLRALVRQYIRTGEPVGSEALANLPALNVSAATIRNELAALEEMGYLTQPHTSAGRIPTDLAYRYYVDMLPAKSRLRDVERLAIVHFFDEALADVDEILRGTTHLLSRLTRYASLALAPSPGEISVARAELIRLGSATLLLVVLESGRVEKRLIEVQREPGEEEVERISRMLTEESRQRSLPAARTALGRRAGSLSRGLERTILDHVTDALRSIEEAAEAEHVFMSGVANIATEQAFERRESLRQIFEALEQESQVLRLLREAAANPSVSVTIGKENPVPEMWEASVVAASYGAAGRSAGTIGVVGPTRMDYAAAISAVRAVSDRLSAAVEALSP
jgi:heat-inducible transcriptional repressor